MLNQPTADRIRAKVEALISQDLTVTDFSGTVLSSPTHEAGEKIKIPKATAIEFRQGTSPAGYILLTKKLPDTERIAPLINSIAELVLHQQTLLEQIPNQEERLDKFVYDLLNGPETDEAILMAEAQVFDLDLSVPKIIIAISIADPALTGHMRDPGNDYEIRVTRYRHSISRCLDSFYTANRQYVVAYLGQNNFCVVKSFDANGPDLKETLLAFKRSADSFYQIVKAEVKQPLTMGIGNYTPGIKGLRQGYQEALSAIELGSQMWDTDKVYHIDDYGVVAPLLSGVDETNIHFSQDLLQKINPSQETIKTLEAFFKFDMSLTKTSDFLGIHRNTLVYRLDRIAETLDLDPRIFDDAVQIKLAMLYPKFVENHAD